MLATTNDKLVNNSATSIFCCRIVYLEHQFVLEWAQLNLIYFTIEHLYWFGCINVMLKSTFFTHDNWQYKRKENQYCFTTKFWNFRHFIWLTFFSSDKVASVFVFGIFNIDIYSFSICYIQSFLLTFIIAYLFKTCINLFSRPFSLVIRRIQCHCKYVFCFSLFTILFRKSRSLNSSKFLHKCILTLTISTTPSASTNEYRSILCIHVS